MIIVTCPECTSRYSIPDSAVLKGVPTLTCTKCLKKFKPILDRQAEKNQQNQQSQKRTKQETDLMGEGQSKNINADQAPGWLVVHDENTSRQTFSLKLGRQVIGRKDPDMQCELMIDTDDMYMSRNHFIIECRVNRAGSIECILSDYKSKNHTFINTRSLHEVKKNDAFLLTGGDIIQAGLTKIVFKSSLEAGSAKEAEDLVKNKPKGKTVLIGK